MANIAVPTTDFNFPGQTALYHGKVRDVYTIADKYLVMIATDRISAFDVILPRPIPFKGQVLNQIADYFLQATADIAPNWLISTPHPNVSLGYRCQPFKIEMIVRGCLVGSAWRGYKDGNRDLCGNKLPEGMSEYDAFTQPLITPTTKADAGHDEDITPAEIIKQGLATEAEFDELSKLALDLFKRGQEMAAKQGLVLADTKYEFGKYEGKIYLIDEIHTPDSSRYFYADSYNAYVNGKKDELPRHLSKEFVREWLMEKGFNGEKDQAMPDMDDDFVNMVSERYIELYEQITGKSFNRPSASDDILKNIESCIVGALEKL